MNIEKEILELKQRNEKVDIAKEWEISLTRRSLILIFTYIAVAFYLKILEVEYYCFHALVPAFAFTLSTLSLPIFKNLWFKYIKK